MYVGPGLAVGLGVSEGWRVKSTGGGVRHGISVSTREGVAGVKFGGAVACMAALNCTTPPEPESVSPGDVSAGCAAIGVPNVSRLKVSTQGRQRVPIGHTLAGALKLDSEDLFIIPSSADGR